MNNNKPKILLYANVYETTVGQQISYVNYFSNFGDVILIGSTSDLAWALEIGDILALPGGADVLSTKYHDRPGLFASKSNPHYEFLDKNLLEPWLATGKPIIGICRGLQVLNVVMGGTLFNHIDGHVQYDDDRASNGQKLYTGIPDSEIVWVNSFHHQGIKKLAPGFNVLGWTDLETGCLSTVTGNYYNKRYYIQKDGGQIKTNGKMYPMLPEVIKHQTHPYIAFQYHPEDFFDPFSTALILKTLIQYTSHEEKDWTVSHPYFKQEEIKSLAVPAQNPVKA